MLESKRMMKKETIEMPTHLKFCLKFVQIRPDANGAANCLFEFNTKIIGFHWGEI